MVILGGMIKTVSCAASPTQLDCKRLIPQPRLTASTSVVMASAPRSMISAGEGSWARPTGCTWSRPYQSGKVVQFDVTKAVQEMRLSGLYHLIMS